MKRLHLTHREEWRQWLSQHHASVRDGVWLAFYKKETGKPTMNYNDAVEEALCFGWIDSIIKKVDNEQYIRKFTPRRPGSKWSALNRQRAEKMLAAGQMAEAGKIQVDFARKNGLWSDEKRPDISLDIGAGFTAALTDNPAARKNFDKLAPSHQRHYILWINQAKRPETRQKRIAEAIELLTAGQPLGLK